MFWASNDFDAALQLETTFLAYGVRVVLPDGSAQAWTNIRRRAQMAQMVVPIRPAIGSRPARSIIVPATNYDHRAALKVTNAQFSDDIAQTDNMEMTLGFGAALDEARVRAGFFDNCPFMQVIFDWKTPLGADGIPRAMLRMRGELGERIIRGREATWKLRSLSNKMRGEVLETTSRDARARWGDPELAFFDLNGPTHDGFAAQVQTQILEVDPQWPRRRFRLNVPNTPDNRFADGMVWFLSGDNAGFASGILIHEPGTNWFVAMRATPRAMQPGDSLKIRIRVPRTLDEHKLFFGTGKWFSGEPMIPSIESSNRITN